MRNLYPPFEAYRKDWLKVSDLHEICFEESGNPTGRPVVFLHGGPGSGSKPHYRQFYNPQKYRIILFDQRGCGQSKPLGELEENTTHDLVEDLEKLRRHLKIKNWIVHGGSWGSTLALTYAEVYRERIKALILRGIFTGREKEVAWLFQGVSLFYPDAYDQYVQDIHQENRKDLVSFWHQKLTQGSPEEVQKAVVADSIWSHNLMKLIPDYLDRQKIIGDRNIAEKKIYFHYAKGKFFLKEGELLEKAGRLANIPGVIIQGRYDLCCPPQTAWELHQKWPQAELVMVPGAGHHSSEPGIIDKTIEYTDKFADL